MSEKKKLSEKIKEKENREKRKKQEEIQQKVRVFFRSILKRRLFSGVTPIPLFHD